MPVTLINPFVVPTAQEAVFVEGWKRTAAAFAGKPGYLDTRLHRSLDPGARFRFVNVAHWASAEAWSDAMTAFPPSEAGVQGIEASPALYRPVQGGTVEPGGASAEDAVRGIEQELARAYQQNDVAALGRILADGYVVTDGPGTTSGKAKVLDDHQARRLHVASFHFNEMQVRTLGAHAAVVTGQYTWDATYAGHPIPGTFRYLRAYALAGEGWQVVAGQVTPVLAPRP